MSEVLIEPSRVVTAEHVAVQRLQGCPIVDWIWITGDVTVHKHWVAISIQRDATNSAIFTKFGVSEILFLVCFKSRNDEHMSRTQTSAAFSQQSGL